MRITDNHRYDDIIDLPHPISSVHPQMSRHDRAAQFSPFAALTGYEDAVKETARLTSDKMELDDTTIAVLNEKIQILKDNITSRPAASVTYFVPDEKKKGGEYVTVDGNVKRIDEHNRVIIFTNNELIPMDDIIEIKSDIFKLLQEQ